MKYIFCLLLIIAAPAWADSPRESFDRINACIKKQDTSTCRQHVTASSIQLYDRFVSYGLTDCLPKDANFVSQTPAGKSVLIRASTNDGGKERFMRLLFVQEEDRWKLDVPESLHTAMGDNWQNQVNLIEQIYLLMKQNMGDKLNCTMIRDMARSKSQKANNP